MHYIGVIDGNNFFVSCERLFRPDLLRKPVLVLSSNDGCVVARSQEVKDMGISMGVPYFQIKDMLKKSNVTVFSSHFTLYRDISTRVFSVVKRELPNKQQYSIDEAFFTLEAESVTAAESELRRIKRLVEQEVGIPVSIGLAATKTQAKYANRVAKKTGGVTIFTPKTWQEMTGDVALSELWGVGRHMIVRYRAAGLLTVNDLLAAPHPRVDALFGIVGLRLQAELAGQVMYPVEQHSTAQKSIMSSRSFENTTTKLAVVKDAIAYHIRQATEELRGLGLQAGALSVSIRPSRHGDYVLRGGSLQVFLTTPTVDTALLLKTASSLVEKLFEADVPYKKAGIVLGELTTTGVIQASLFTESEESTGATRLMKTIDGLNAKFGRGMVQLGRHTATETWSAKRADLSPAYTTNWAMVPVVKG